MAVYAPTTLSIVKVRCRQNKQDNLACYVVLYCLLDLGVIVKTAMAFCSKLYGKDELLKEYIASTEKYEDELFAMVKKTLVPFVYMGILSDQDKKKWAEEDQQYGTEERFRRVIKEVLQSGLLDRFIKFTRALTFKNTHTEITQAYNFFPRLFEVGLVDPLQGQ